MSQVSCFIINAITQLTYRAGVNLYPRLNKNGCCKSAKVLKEKLQNESDISKPMILSTAFSDYFLNKNYFLFFHLFN